MAETNDGTGIEVYGKMAGRDCDNGILKCLWALHGPRVIHGQQTIHTHRCHHSPSKVIPG